VARIWPGWRYFSGPNLARLEVFDVEVFFGGPNLARLEVFFWPEIGPVGGIYQWPEFGPIGGIFLARFWPGWRYSARFWPGWRYFFGGIFLDGPVLARQYACTFRRYLGEENGAMNREVRLFGSINAIT
jgi:hypothetical protein